MSNATTTNYSMNASHSATCVDNMDDDERDVRCDEIRMSILRRYLNSLMNEDIITFALLLTVMVLIMWGLYRLLVGGSVGKNLAPPNLNIPRNMTL